MADGELAYPMRAYAYYMDKGLPPHQAAALAANSAHEGPESTRQLGDKGTALGRFQWREGRQTGLFDYAKQNKVDPYADETQWDYALHEMRGAEKAHGDKFFASKDVTEANDAMLGFLRPAGYDPKTGDVSQVPSRTSRSQMAAAISGMQPIPDPQNVAIAGAPAMQAPDAQVPGLLPQGPNPIAAAIKPIGQAMQAQQTAGLLAAGQPQYTPTQMLQLPGLLSPRAPNPNAIAMLPKLGRGLLG